MKGQVVGGYRVVGELGRGGMGAVYRCEDLASGRQAALKLLTKGGDATPNQRRRFEREALALAKLSHPNVLQVYTAGEEKGVPYIVTALHAQGSLEDRIERDGVLEPLEAARIGLGLAAGLGAVHAEGILHRDLKPGNVLFDARDEPLLCDFGLAKDLDRAGETQRLTQTGLFLGTPGFWSPEQAAGRGGVGPATDVYGLGATLYMALAGEPLFSGATIFEVMVATHEHKLRPLERLRPGLPPLLTQAVMACLARDPAERSTLAELGAALQSVLDGQVGEGRTRGRRLALIGVGLATCLGSAAALAWSLSPAANSRSSPADSPISSALASPGSTLGASPQVAGSAASATPFLSPERRRIELPIGDVRSLRFVDGGRSLLTFSFLTGDAERPEVEVTRWDLLRGKRAPGPPLRLPGRRDGFAFYALAGAADRFLSWEGARAQIHTLGPEGEVHTTTHELPATISVGALAPQGDGPVALALALESGEVCGLGGAVRCRSERVEAIRHLALGNGGRLLALGGVAREASLGYLLELRSYPDGRALSPPVEAILNRHPRQIAFLTGPEPRVVFHDGLSLNLLSARGLEPVGPTDVRGMSAPAHAGGLEFFALFTNGHALTLSNPLTVAVPYDVALWNLETRALVSRFFADDEPRYRALDVSPDQEWVALGGFQTVQFVHRSRFLGGR